MFQTRTHCKIFWIFSSSQTLPFMKKIFVLITWVTKKHNSKYILTDEGTGFPFFIFIHWHLINISVFPLTAKQGQFKHVQTEINVLGTVGHPSWKAELYLHCPYLSPGYKKCGFKGRQWRERGMLSIRYQFPEEKSPFMIKSSAKAVQSRKLYLSLM